MASVPLSLAQSTCDHCPLLGLPPELRLLIYTELFSACIFRAEYMNGHWVKTKRHVHNGYSTADCVALLASCKTMYLEAKPAFNASVHFSLTCFQRTPSDRRPALESDQMQRLIDIPDAIAHARKAHFGVQFVADADEGSAFTTLPIKHAMKYACNAETVHISIEILPGCGQYNFGWSMLSLFWDCDEIREHKAVTADIMERQKSSSLNFSYELLKLIGAEEKSCENVRECLASLDAKTTAEERDGNYLNSADTWRKHFKFVCKKPL